MSSNLKYLYALCNYTIKIAFIVHMISGIWDISNIGTLGLVCEDQTNGILMLWNNWILFWIIYDPFKTSRLIHSLKSCNIFSGSQEQKIQVPWYHLAFIHWIKLPLAQSKWILSQLSAVNIVTERNIHHAKGWLHVGCVLV